MVGWKHSAIKTITESGSYKVSVIDRTECSSTAKTSIEMHECKQPKAITGIHSGTLTILSRKGFAVTAGLAIYSVTGQRVYKQENVQIATSDFNLSIAELASGMFFQTALSGTGDITCKFIR